MRPRRETNVLIFVCMFVSSIGASKCPESRKPHVTSCTIYYNCVNLPEGGYVWVPVKCAEGLVFQPYLRICVLPGDTWTCDNLSTDKSIVTERYERPELIDPSQTSYLGYAQDSSSLKNRPSFDSSHSIEDSSELANLQPLATPYPLIEIGDTRQGVKENHPKDSNSLAISQAIEKKVDNYLYRYFNSQLHTKLATVGSNGENNFTLLRGIIDRMLLYERIDGFGSGTNCEPSTQSNLKKNDYKKDMINYLLETFHRNPTRGKSKRKNNRKSTTTERNETGKDRIVSIDTTVIDEPINSLIDGRKSDNNIVVIKGNLGSKEYITISKYKSLSSNVNLQIIEILPCAKGVRLPNRTDCTRYYTCDPETASITQFSCSPRTAFNDYNRICEIQRYKSCVRERNEQLETTTTPYENETTSFPSETEIPGNNEPCQNIGKFVDTMSDKHYYVCYSSQRNPTRIESLRMICPNDLIFCQERRVCTSRKRCYEF